MAEDLKSEYDFSKLGKPVRGKYHHFIGQARTLRVCHSDGSVTVETVASTIELDPDETNL